MLAKLLEFYNANKVKIIGGAVVLLILIMQSLYIYDLRRQRAALTAQNSTMDEKFKKIGEAYQAQGQVYQTDKEAWEAAKAAQGKQIADAMAKDGAKVRALYVANGQLKAEIDRISNVPVPSSPTGAFSNITLAQVRVAGPSLTSVTLSYDPANPDNKQRLSGNWNNNREDYLSTVGEWQKKDKGYIATMRLTRTVYDINGKIVGTEDIPLTNATATFGPVSFGGEQAIDPVPRFTFYGGLGKDTDQKKTVSVLGIDYRFTNKVGLGGGIVGNTVFAAVSYRFGK
jgi:hypothetical protein